MSTDQVPTVAYERGSMAKGEAQQANQMTTGTPKPTPVGGPSSAPPELQAAAEEFLFSRPTDRPNEPVTQGLPFGAGAAYVQPRAETDATFRERTANTLLTSGLTDPNIKRFAERLLRGE